MTKKILFTYGHARAIYSWKMFGEILARLLNNPEYEVFWLACQGNFSGACWYSTKSHLGYCNKCKNNCRLIANYLGINEKNIIPIKKYKKLKFKKFNSMQELINFKYDKYNLGLSAASTLMTITRDYNYDLKKYKKNIDNILNTEQIILHNVIDYFEKYHFDEIHCFTGRTPTTYPLITYAQTNDIPYTVYEAGSKPDKLRIDVNTTPHDFYNLKNDIKKVWDRATVDRAEIASKWYEDRRAGKFQAIESFTKDQCKGLLPKDFDTNKENIAIFNSSADEIFAFDSWKHPLFDKDNDIIEKVLEHFKNDKTKHFYLRVHPNLTQAKKNKTSQIREINQLKKRYKNLTVIEPDEKIDTYALVDAANKVLTFGSSVGCEATYWNKISILAGKTQYEDDGCTYNATSFEELFELIDAKDLKPKPKETAYPYGYYNEVYGEKYKYFKIDDLKNGKLGELKIKG